MLPKLSNVLLVTDFSDTANRALPYAYAIASPGGEVHLLHVIEYQGTPSPLYAHYSQDELANPEKRKEAVAKVEAHLETLIPKEAAEKKIKTRVAGAIHPTVADGIVAEAKQRGCEAIVIGSHGRGGVARALLGSVAEGVIRNATVPVLVVPQRDA